LVLFSTDIFSQVINIGLFIVFILFLNKIMIYQIMFKLERSAQMFAQMSKKSEQIVIKKLKKNIRNFLEFFVISPVNIDPFGVMKKLEHVIDLEKERFNYFVGEIAPELNTEEKANMVMGLSGAMSMYQLKKIIRHFVELIKKTKSIQLAMLIQMQLPLIESMAKALLKGTEALTNGWAIGDGIGPYIVAKSIGNSKIQEVDDETIVCRKKYKNKDLIVIKAKGPGGRTGNTGRVLEKIASKEKIAKIITIDAAAKLEGEKTGSIAEGIGVAMGGIGVERSHIEEVAVKRKLPLDSIIVKMSHEEAIMPMRKPILDATPEVLKVLDQTIKRTKQSGKIILVGVGNTSGVGNNEKDADKAEKNIKEIAKKISLKEKQTKKKFRLRFPF